MKKKTREITQSRKPIAAPREEPSMISAVRVQSNRNDERLMRTKIRQAFSRINTKKSVDESVNLIHSYLRRSIPTISDVDSYFDDVSEKSDTSYTSDTSDSDEISVPPPRRTPKSYSAEDITLSDRNTRILLLRSRFLNRKREKAKERMMMREYGISDDEFDEQFALFEKYEKLDFLVF